MIKVENLVKHFGGIHAVDNASLVIETGSITGLIGPNGAGKTTLFNVIAGVYKPTSGRVLLDGDDITGLAPHELFARGMLRTFQIAHEFSTLTVRENLMMVPGDQSGERLMEAWFRPADVRDQEASIRAKADEVIDFLQISQVADELAGNLSGGQKKLLELGRTMMVDAKIVFLDEVGAGVNRTLLNTIASSIERPCSPVYARAVTVDRIDRAASSASPRFRAKFATSGPALTTRFASRTNNASRPSTTSTRIGTSLPPQRSTLRGTSASMKASRMSAGSLMER